MGHWPFLLFYGLAMQPTPGPTIRYRTVKAQLLNSFQEEGHSQRRAIFKLLLLTLFGYMAFILFCQ